MTASTRILLVTPSLAEVIYRRTRIRAAASVGPMVGFASMAASLLAAGHEVRVLDGDIEPNPSEALRETLAGWRPEWVGITCQTATYDITVGLARMAREHRAKVALGGPHASALPDEALATGAVDALIVGEGEQAFMRLASGEDPASIQGVRTPGGAVASGAKARAEGPADLDALPLPAWQVYDSSRYSAHMSPLFTRRPPFANLETSRGCPFRCSFCTEAATKYRSKSPARVVQEFAHAVKHGFREMHIVDDLFSLDMDRAKDVCRALIAAGNDVPWTLDTGIRVDRIDEELAELLAKAGCWQVSLGIESGNREVLREVTKAITPEVSRRAVSIARRAGLETIGLFIQGLPGETVASLEETIAFARSVPLDWATFRVAIPYPGTQLHERWKREGILKSEQWSEYLRQPTGTVLYEQPGLAFQTLVAYNERAYRDFYLRIGYAIRRLVDALRAGRAGIYLRAFLQTRWFGPTRVELQARA